MDFPCRTSAPEITRNIPGHGIVAPIGAQASTTSTGKDDGIIAASNLSQPRTQDIRSCPSKRRRSFFAALANDAYVGTRAQTYACTAQTRDLRQTQSRLNGQQHERVVAPTRMSAEVWGAQECVGLLSLS